MKLSQRVNPCLDAEFMTRAARDPRAGTVCAGRLGRAVIGFLAWEIFLQSSSAAPADSDAGSQLQEVIVTAQRRQENLQNVPVSVQVVSSQTLIQQNLNSLIDLSEIDPSVTVSNSGRSGNLYIRGMGSGDNQSFDQSVGLFIDDIYHGRARTAAATFLDVDRVEILKGPQSTFFGNNAIAGAFNIVTKAPTSQLQGYARALYGEHGQYAVEAAAGGGITDSIAVRVAATANGTGGWVTNEATGGKQPDQDNTAGRVTIRFKPTDEFDATLKVEGGANDNHSGLFLSVGNCPPPPPYTNGGFCAAAVALGVPIGERNRNSENSGQQSHLSTFEDVLTVNYTRWDQTFTSVSGFYNYHYNLNLDAAGLPGNVFNIQAPEKYSQFSQELRVASPTGQRFEYLGGAYFQMDQLAFRQDFSLFFLTPALESIPPFAPLVPYLPLGQRTEFEQHEHTYSVFGSLTWNATERVKISGGLRGSQVEKSYDWSALYATSTQDYGGLVPLPDALQPFGAALGLGAPGALRGDRADRALMPSAKVQYQFKPDVMGYLSYARGFKAGGFNGTDASGIATNLLFEPEHVNAYEAGVKSRWLGDRVIANVAVFRSDYSNLQVSQDVLAANGSIIPLVRNAASSRAEGVEYEGQWLPARNLMLSASVTYLDSFYVSYPNANPTTLQQVQGVAFQDLSGQSTAYAPRWSGSLSGSYGFVLPHEYHLNAELNAYFSGTYNLGGDTDVLKQQERYARLDARLSVATSDGRGTIDLIGKNLTNRTVCAFCGGLPTALGSTLVQYEQPRNVSVQLRYRW